MRPVLSLLAAAVPALAGVHEVWWNVTYVEDANPDGLFSRRVIGVNGTWPPPILDLNSTDDILVHASNSLDEPLTIHHHGMFFNSTSWQDGAQGVSQCGIPTGQSWDYMVPVSTSGQSGTYWWHSHANGQYVDGLRSGVVIHPQKEKHQYDEEFTIILGDWYHNDHATLLKKFISVANPGGAEPVPNSALVYFAQGDKYLGPIEGTNPSPVTSAVGFNENATLPFQPGKTYRLRVINMSAFAMFYFWIDGHEMRIIEADGVDTEESSIDLIAITVAQRYSILVTARNDTSQNWAIHANMDTDMFDTVPATLNPNVTTSITYNKDAPLTDLGVIGIDDLHDVPDLDLVPIDVVPMLPAERTIELEVLFDTLDDGTNRAMFNHKTYNMPLVPTLFSAMTLGENATNEAVYGPYSFVLNHLEVVDLVVQNGDVGKHPFHLHGHSFQLVQRSTDYTSDDPTLNPPINETQTNPMRRDTVQVPSGEGVTLRFVANNPGAWIFHCHIEWHLQAGLAVTFIEAPLEAQARGSIPQVGFDQCAALGLPSKGNAVGRTEDILNLAGLPEGPFEQVLGWRPKGIGAMFGCVFTAVLGMLTVTWYSLGGHISEAEMEHEARLHQEAKAKKGKFFGLWKPKA
ncbi:Fet3 protein [Irpex rosettiformis]|uniref:Fet3 protein n=1 Tax=Irpex rosettiformis TaxID=378272 RepID=A0ACB8UEC8_9APHY|nr:Fet3 protein [Irpex rosettiformis]